MPTSSSSYFTGSGGYSTTNNWTWENPPPAQANRLSCAVYYVDTRNLTRGEGAAPVVSRHDYTYCPTDYGWVDPAAGRMPTMKEIIADWTKVQQRAALGSTLYIKALAAELSTEVQRAAVDGQWYLGSHFNPIRAAYLIRRNKEGVSVHPGDEQFLSMDKVYYFEDDPHPVDGQPTLLTTPDDALHYAIKCWPHLTQTEVLAKLKERKLYNWALATG